MMGPDGGAGLTEGLIGSIIGLLGLALRVPDHFAFGAAP